MPRLRIHVIFALIVVAALASPAAAQAPTTGKLIVTVVDPSRLVIPAATVTVVGLDETTKKKAIQPAKSSDKGIATFEGLPLGRYSVSGEFPGFELGVLNDVRLKAGDNKHALVLPLAKMTTEITVGRDAQTTASDRGSTFGSAMTREQIEALSDDPDEMARQLQDMAGPGTTIRVDSFEGQQLPPKAQIKSIHITRDMFAAENHSAGMGFIDIITQPGMGALRANTRFSFYDSAMDGSNPLIPKKGPAQTENFSVGLGGTLIKEKSNFYVQVGGMKSYRTPNFYAAVPAGTIATNINLRQPTDTFSVSGNFDYALTRDQTLRISASHNNSSSENQGVGAYDLIGRAYSNDNSSTYLRIQEAGPIGRRFFINTRLAVNWSDSTSKSVLEEQTVTVLDAFTSGGAQRAGGRHTRTFSFQSDLDYVRGIHSWRLGVSLDGGNYHADDNANYLGTYTFGSLDAYEAGLPLSYTRRFGNPNITYFNGAAGVYVQDDIRVSKNLTLSPGVRYEAQTHLADHNNIGPRFGVTWSPFKSGKTTMRVSAGIFYDWLGANTYEQTLRVDGVRQTEVNIVNPPYPDPGTPSVFPPTNRYLLASDNQMVRYTRLSAGIDQQVGKIVKVTALYTDNRNSNMLVGENLNAPVNGVRPNPAMANIIAAVSDGSGRSKALSLSAVFNYTPQVAMAAATTGRVFDWKRGLMCALNYSLAKSENNTDGPFSPPATGTLATEWGPSNFDRRHQIYFSMLSNAVKNLQIMFSINRSSGTPYTIRTGYDNNGDLLLNDRPAGVGRNTLRADGWWTSYANITYTIGLGKKTVPGGTGVMITGGGAAGMSMTTMAMAAQPRYRLTLSANINNITNHANWTGYSGVMTSPFFGKPTNVDGVRQFNLSAGFSF